MATMEKPKQKKKKKVKETNDSSGLLENIYNDTLPSTSTVNTSIQSVECSISNKLQTMTIVIDKINAVNNFEMIKPVPKDDIIKDESATSISEINFQPTAPIIKNENIYVGINSLSENVTYQSLKTMENIEHLTASNALQTKIQINVKPFTEMELNEIYQNQQIEQAQLFENEFIDAELNANYSARNHILYEYLLRYSRSRIMIKATLADLENLRQCSGINEKNVWEKITLTSSGRNQCPKCHKTHTETKSYEFYRLNDNILQNLTTNLKEIQEKILFDHVRYIYENNVLQLQIEQEIRRILTLCDELKDIRSTSPITLNSTFDPKLQQAATEIRCAISILFVFLRNPLMDKIVLANLKSWLQKIISVQLRIASWQDHMFLLYHILRSPNGTAKWAAAFIQIPDLFVDLVTPFSSTRINHCMSILSILLLPIKKRDDFLQQLVKDNVENVSDPCKDDIWTVIDSDGEEGITSEGVYSGLKETDLVCLLNQIPLENLMKILMQAVEKGDSYEINSNHFTGHYVIKLYAFSTHVVRVLGNGLLTYNTERYRQFAKRLARLVRHIVLYITDINALFIKQPNVNNDVHLLNRVQVEYNSFLIRTCRYIYNSRSLGTWQYLVDLPFSSLNKNSLWILFHSLCMGFAENVTYTDQDFISIITNDNFFNQFNDISIEIAADDLYYLLQTFCNMVLFRDKDDWDFIKTITAKIFEIGFTNKQTKDICYKTARDLLINIALKYPEIITDLLIQTKKHVLDINTFSVYIFKSLPLDKWYPTWNDFEIVSAWLLNFNIDSVESSTARIIISNLNWGLNENDELFLSHEIHVRMACLIAQISSKHVPEVIGITSITDSVRQVSNLYNKTISVKQQFINWCWNVVSKLRLHCMDQSRTLVRKFLNNPTEMLKYIPEMERIEPIFQGVSESKPIALYISILISLCGHSVPEICHKGFLQLHLLLNDYRQIVVIRCLNLITPLFLECPESLCKSDKFQSVLSNLLAADRTYFNIAKDLLKSNYPGPVVELLGNMIQSQITDYVTYGLPSPTPLIKLWLQCLINNSSNWTKDWNITYVIDLILKIAYQFPDCMNCIKQDFRVLFSSYEENFKINKSSSFNLFGSSGQTVFLIPPEHAWLGLLTYEIEHELFELKLWPEMLRILNQTTTKNSVDVAIKKASNIVGCQGFSSQTLVLYKLLNYVLTVNLGHPLLPVVCQKIFCLYLSRIPLTDDEKIYCDNFGVSNKFYDANSTLFKKFKKRLTEIQNYYKEATVSEKDEIVVSILNKTMKLFDSFILWLEEPRLNKMDVSRLNFQPLPPQYDSHRLQIIFEGNNDHWSEFIYLPNIRKQQKYDSLKWLKECFRSPSTNLTQMTSRQTDDSNPNERIIKRLKSYDQPEPPPVVQSNFLIVENLPPLNKFNGIFVNNYDLVKKYAKDFQLDINELQSHNASFIETLRSLYDLSSDIVHVDKVCKCVPNETTIIRIVLKINTTKLNNRIEALIIGNRKRYIAINDKLMLTPPSNLTLAIVKLNQYTNQLVQLFQRKNTENENCDEILTIANNIYYNIILKDRRFVFMPANDLCSNILIQLGNIIKHNQSVLFLKKIIQQPEMLEIMLQSFDPRLIMPKMYIEMYSFIIDLQCRQSHLNVVLIVLKKFDLKNWLDINRPRLAEITILIELIMKGLQCDGPKSDANFSIQNELCKHLIYIYEHNFPEHYGEVLQVVLKSSSEKHISPTVMLALINSLYRKCGCELLSDEIDPIKQKSKFVAFANKQKLFNYKEIIDTSMLLAKYYQCERLQNGLHGLYPKHTIYCDKLSLIMASLSYSAVVSIIYTYPGVLANQLVDWLWPIVCDLFSPWLVPYHPHQLQESTSNWIKHITSSNPILLPCNVTHITFYQKIFSMFISCVQFIFEMLPAGTSILNQIFHWYEIHFANTNIPKPILSTVHNSLLTLSWDKMVPNILNMESLNRILLQFLPECHVFVGYIFLNIDWLNGIAMNLNNWNYEIKQKMISFLLMIIVKISCEPTIRESPKLIQSLEDSLKLPWHFLENQAVEGVLDWFVLSSEPSILLKLPNQSLAVDNGILTLLQTVCGMTKSHENSISSLNQIKRTLYVKTVVRILRACGSKYHKLLTTDDGIKAFHSAILELLMFIDNILNDLYHTESQEAINLAIEIVGTTQINGETVSKLFIDGIIAWESTVPPGNMFLCCMLNAIGSCKTFSLNLSTLLEFTLINYFRIAETTKNQHKPSWNNVVHRIGPIKPQFEGSMIVQNHLLLCLHLFSFYNLKYITNLGDKITYLNKLNEWVENCKNIEYNEPKLCAIWGLAMVCGVYIFENSFDSKNQLLKLARYFQVISTQSEGWGEGLLGAIGLKKDGISNKRRILTRSLACLIFSLFLEQSSNGDLQRCKEYETAMEELKTTLNHRKFNDIRFISENAIDIIKSREKGFISFRNKVCSLIRLFYNDSFLLTTEEFWNF